MLKRCFSTLVECGIPYMRSIKHIPFKHIPFKHIPLKLINTNYNSESESESDFCEYGIPYMRDIPKEEYKKLFKNHEKQLYKSVSSD